VGASGLTLAPYAPTSSRCPADAVGLARALEKEEARNCRYINRRQNQRAKLSPVGLQDEQHKPLALLYLCFSVRFMPERFRFVGAKSAGAFA